MVRSLALSLLIAASASAQVTTGVGVNGGVGIGPPATSGSAIAEAITATSFSETATIGGTLTCESWPCPVFFDATATTAIGVTDPLHEAWYEWTFGDSGAGTRTIAGRAWSLNEGVGPVAGHTYASSSWPSSCAGSDCAVHTGTLSVTIESGGVQVTETASLTVNEISPDDLFPTTDTTCYCDEATCTDDTGCPAGATNGGDASTTLGTAEAACITAAPQRCLFERGVTFTGGSSQTYGLSKHVVFGSYGTGTATLSHSYSGTTPFKISGCGPTQWVDLTLSGPGTETTPVWDSATTDVLAECVGVTRFRFATGSTNRPHALTNMWTDALTNPESHSQIYFYDTVLTDYGNAGAAMPAALGLNVDMGYFVNGEISGSQQADIQPEHIARLPQAKRFVFDTNRFADAHNAKNMVTIRNHFDDGYPANAYIAVTRNVFEGGSSVGAPASTLGLCDTNGNDPDERQFEHEWVLRNAFTEGVVGINRNQYVVASLTGAVGNAYCRDISIEQNYFQLTGLDDSGTGRASGSQIGSTVTDVRVRANTVVNNDAGRTGETQVTDFAVISGESVCENNIIYNASGPNDTCDTGSAGNNVEVTSDPFNVVAGAPASGVSLDWDDLDITTGSAALDVGVLDHINTDAEGNPRPVSTTDAGVAEKQ